MIELENRIEDGIPCCGIGEIPLASPFLFGDRPIARRL